MATNGDGNFTKEREVKEAVIDTECHDSSDITAKSSVDGGLDNVGIGAGDEGERPRVGEPTVTEIRDGVSTGEELKRVDCAERLVVANGCAGTDSTIGLGGGTEWNSEPYESWDAVAEKAN